MTLGTERRGAAGLGVARLGWAWHGMAWRGFMNVKVFEGEQTITLLLGDSPAIKTLVIDANLDQLFFCGERIMTTYDVKGYDPHYMLEKNKGKKLRCFTNIWGNNVLAIDVGWDGRVFVKCFSRKDYYEFRGHPNWIASYWHNRATKQKLWFEQDLSTPKKVFSN